MNDLGVLAIAHLRLVLIALGIATVLGVGIGIVSARRPFAERFLLGSSSLIQTVPAIALLAVMVPLLGWVANGTGLPLSSIGEVPALIALTLYALLPIARGMVVGVRAIDPAIIEAARAVGMTDAQRLKAIELPLAAPIVIAGLRTAAVWTVGMATLATPVGAISLGNAIFGGLQTRHGGDVLAGCAAAALMAIVIDGALGAIQRRAQGRRAGMALRVAISGLVFGALGASVMRCGASEHPIRIGAKTFTEQLVLAEILGCAIDEPVEIRPSLGTTVAFDALRAGDLDVYVEYTGTAWTTILGRDGTADRATIARDVEAALEHEYGVHVIARLGFENAYAMVVRGDDPARRLSDLGAASERSIGGDYEFFVRPEWSALQERYHLSPRETRTMDPSLLYQALRNGAVDAIAGYTTDGRIDALGLRVLEDDRDAIPPYDAIVLVSARLARSRPDIVTKLRQLENTIDADAMRAFNHAVDSGAASPVEAARGHASCRATRSAFE